MSARLFKNICCTNNMARCHLCKKKTSVAFECKHCDSEYCSKCRLPETHACPGLQSLKSAKLELLADTLNRQKIESSKVVKF